MGNMLKSRVFWAAVIVAVFAGLYALLGFYAAPKIIRSKAIAFAKEEYGRDLAIGEVRFNPFKLQLEIKDVALPDTDRQTMLGFKRLFVDFEVSSLWHRAYTFKDIDHRCAHAPDGHPAGRAGEPRGPRSQGKDPAGAEARRRQAAERLDPVAGRPPWTRRTTSTSDVARRPTSAASQPIEFSLKDFRTTPEGGDFGSLGRRRGRRAVRLEGSSSRSSPASRRTATSRSAT